MTQISQQQISINPEGANSEKQRERPPDAVSQMWQRRTYLRTQAKEALKQVGPRRLWALQLSDSVS